jgi:hypothetical protein
MFENTEVEWPVKRMAASGGFDRSTESAAVLVQFRHE